MFHQRKLIPNPSDHRRSPVGSENPPPRGSLPGGWELTTVWAGTAVARSEGSLEGAGPRSGRPAVAPAWSPVGGLVSGSSCEPTAPVQTAAL